MTPPTPVFSKGRDLVATADRLRPWLSTRLDAASVDIDHLEYPQGAGVSNETILLRARYADTAADFVLRVCPTPQYQMFLDPRFRLQYDILAALRQHDDVRVPEALWFEEDPAVLGRPFYLMRRMRGRVPVSMPVYNATGWLAEATPAQRHTLWNDAMRQLAAVHRVPVEAVRFVDRPERGLTGDEQQLSYWRDYADWAVGGDMPGAVVRLFDWLRNHRPSNSVVGLSWGDARIGNMMFDDDFRVVGVMDWEQVSFAGPVSDLAWWLLFDEAHSTGQGLPRLPGLGTRDETIALWQELTGLRADHLRWHEVFAGVKAGLLSMRSRRMLELPPSGTRRYSFLRRACEMVGIEETGNL
ncbi:phosphotransferase family protein [Nocardia aurea]|uniref:phosphotransferase family protein n=1 Tax=Nocardia aurea TaxID=2144174 RepID=UPI0033A67D26